MSKCGGCGKFLSGGAACSKCKAIFHRQCVNLTATQSLKQWLCPCCVVNIPRKDNTNTPIKEIAEHELAESPQKYDDANLSTSNDGNDQTLVLEEIRALRADMNNFRKDFSCFRKEVRDEIKELRDIYSSCNNRMDVFSERLDGQESRLTSLEESCKEILVLKHQIQDLKQELHNIEQLSLQNDIEVSGVTEQVGENVMQITSLIVSKIGVTLDERDIVEVCRVGPPRLDKDLAPSTSTRD